MYSSDKRSDKDYQIFPFSVLVIVLFLWSSSFVGIVAVLKYFSPVTFTFLRFLIATFALGISYVFYLVSTGEKPHPPQLKDIPLLVLCGILLVEVYNIGLSYGEISTTPGTASFIISQQPIIVILLLAIIGDKKLSAKICFGIMLGIIGSLFTVLTDSNRFAFTPGCVFVLTAVVGESFYFLLAEKLLSRYTPLELNLYVNVLGTIVLTPASFNLVKDIEYAPGNYIMIIVYMGLITGALANFMWSYCLQKLGASTSSVALYALPLIVIFLDILFRHKIPNLTNVGCGLISLVGAFIVEVNGEKK